MTMHQITAAKQWQPTVLLLCILILFTSCAGSRIPKEPVTERYPCDELERAERSYSAMKRQPTMEEGLMQGMQVKINELEVACDKYQKTVELYIKEYGFSPAVAEKEAAHEGPPTRMDDVGSANSSAANPTSASTSFVTITLLVLAFLVVLGAGVSGSKPKYNFQ